MNLKLRKFPFLLPIFAVVCSELSAQDQQTANPFREFHPPVECEKQLEELASEIQESERLATIPYWPVLGTKLVRVREGRAADRAGMEAGSIIYQRGDLMPWADYLPMLLLPGSSRVRFVDPGGNDRVANVDPGLLGVSLEKNYRLDLAYQRSEVGSRDPKWDRWMIAAGLMHARDRNLAESFLHRAIEAGYRPDVLTDFFQIILHTYTVDGPEKKLEQFFGRFEVDEKIPWLYVPPLHDALTVTGRIDFMKRIADQYGESASYDTAAVERFLRWTHGAEKLPEQSLLARANAAQAESIDKMFFSYRRGKPEEKSRAIAANQKLSAPPGRNASIDFRSRGVPRNFHYQTTVRLRATGLMDRWGTGFRLGFMNRFESGEAGKESSRYPRNGMSYPERLLYVSLARTAKSPYVLTSGSGLPGIDMATTDFVSVPYTDKPWIDEVLQDDFEKYRLMGGGDGEARAMKLDLIQYGYEVGIYLDGICVLHLPADPVARRKFSIYMDAVGIEVTMEGTSIHALHQ